MSLPFRLMSYNPQWRQEFEQSKSSILQATEGWVVDVQHIGGTALPDSIARPVVDLIAAMDSMDGLNEASTLIEGLNFKRVETPTWCEDELSAYLQKPRTMEATHTVLVVRHGGDLWNRCLGITRHLSSDLLDRQRLQNLKQDNFLPGCHAEATYAQAKHEFFDTLAWDD